MKRTTPMTRKHLLSFTTCFSDTGISAVSYMIAPEVLPVPKIVATPVVEKSQRNIMCDDAKDHLVLITYLQEFGSHLKCVSQPWS